MSDYELTDNVKLLVSVTFSSATPESSEVGEYESSGFDQERVEWDADDLYRAAIQYGFHEPSSSTITATTYFTSSSPTEDDEYFRRGVSTYYSLHIHEVNGSEPSDEQMQALHAYLKAPRSLESSYDCSI